VGEAIPMAHDRPSRFGAPLMLAAAVLTSACTAAAGAGLSPASPPTATEPPGAVTAAPIPEPDTSERAVVLPDLTARPITISDLTAMLPEGDTGPATTADEPVLHPRSNESLVTNAYLDRTDEAADIATFGRLTGVSASYTDGGSTAHVWIDLFEDTSGAAGWLTDTAGDMVKRVGGSHQGSIDLTEAEQYPFGEVGEDSIGLILTLDGGARTETIAMFRMGRIVVFTSIVRPDDADARVPVQYLAEETADKVLAVLLGTTGPGVPSRDPDHYEFEFERIVEIGTTRWSASASGTVDGSSVACRASIDHPSLQVTRDLIYAGDRIWAREGSDDYTERGTAGVIDRMLLDLCPGWPIDASGAGLSGAFDDTPASHDIGGLAARGYRGTESDLESALGIDPGTVTVRVFNIWVADGTGWIVDLDLSVSGDTSALLELIGSGFPVGSAAIVTISQRITAIGEAGPVTPPG